MYLLPHITKSRHELHVQPPVPGEGLFCYIWNAKLTETQIFREISIEIESFLIQLESSLFQIESSLFN